MLKIAVSFAQIVKGLPGFKFARPSFVRLKKNEDSFTLYIMDPKNEEELFLLSDEIKKINYEIERPYLIAVAVLGELDEAREVYWYIERRIGYHHNLDLYLDNSVEDDDLIFRIPQSPIELIKDCINSEHDN